MYVIDITDEIKYHAMNMVSTMNVTQVRENLAEVLGRVKFAGEIVTVEKKGKPYAVIMGSKEYERYKAMAKKAFMATVAKIQARNTNFTEEEVLKDVTQAVEEVRQERYERGK